MQTIDAPSRGVGTSNTLAPVGGTYTDFEEQAGSLVVATSQDIPESWADWLAEKRREAWDLRNRTEHIHVASVPTIFIHKWLDEGFNAYLEPVREVERKLRRENLTAFLATEKRAF